jgi:hypothetical protein
MSEKIATPKTTAQAQAKKGAAVRKSAVNKATAAKPAPAPAAAKIVAAPEKKVKKAKKEGGKIKVVRDSFSMPQNDYDKIAELKQLCLRSGMHVKKSELLRAGLHALDKLSAAQLKQAVAALEKIKTGRPKAN